MTVYLQDADLTLHHGDALETLRTLPGGSVNCCITSPPYWGLRDYGTGTWDGGNPADCDHLNHPGAATGNKGAVTSTPMGDVCGRCGARRVDHQLGLEQTPDQFVANLVAVFREVRRVLTDDGTLWLNLGDSYAANYGNGGKGNTGAATSIDKRGVGAKPKDLIGIPWLVARALQEPYYTGRIPRERDRVWLAATIDGEGTICGTAHVRKDDGRTRTMPQVFITNSAQAMLDEALRIWPTSQSDHSRPGDGHLGTVDVFRWIVHGIENKTALVQELYPYLIVKRTQALLAYNLLVLMADAKRLGKSSQAQAVRDKREHVCALMSQLNHAQSVDVPSWCVEPPALYEPGWYLRSAITWCKLNAMPESVTDRPTKATEMVFLLTKNARYWYDAEAIREPHRHDGRQVTQVVGGNGSIQHRDGERWPGTGANARDWWPIATQSFDGAHFATFPEELVRRCLLAGSPEFVCTVCDTPVVHGRQQDISESEAVQAPLRRVRDVLRGAESAVLFPDLLTQAGGTSQTAPTEALRGMRDDVQVSISEDSVLLTHLRGGVGEEDGCESAATTSGLPPIQLEGRQDPCRRVCADLQPGRKEVRPRASIGDGAEDRETASVGRVRPSQEWDQDGQQAGELGVDDAEPAQGHRDVPALRRGVPDSLSPCCGAPMRPGVVLDPFFGSGTTGLVARKHGRRTVGIELSRDYCGLAARRLQQLSLLAEGAA